MKALITGIALIVSTSIGYSQEKTAEERAANQTEQMATSLGLTAEQKDKVGNLNLGIIQKNEAIRTDPNMTAEQKTEAIKGNNEARNYLLKSILTPEQLKKYEEDEASKKVNMSNKKSISQKKRRVQVQETPVKQ